jgi:nitroreductase
VKNLLLSDATSSIQERIRPWHGKARGDSRPYTIAVDFQDVVRKRRMVRAFSDQPVARETVERIIDVARRAPSAGFSQGVEYVVVTEPARRAELMRIAAVGGKQRSGLERAPVHIVVCVSAEIYRQRYRQPDKLRVRGTAGDDELWHVPFWWVDAGAAMMLLLLAATNEGLASFFYGVWRMDELKSLLSVPEEHTPIGMVTIGHRAPDEAPVGSALSQRRRAMQDVVHWEGW